MSKITIMGSEAKTPDLKIQASPSHTVGICRTSSLCVSLFPSGNDGTCLIGLLEGLSPCQALSTIAVYIYISIY